MRLLFIRHGDPNYLTDTLTPAGRKEARLLAKAAPNMDLGICYVSPLGRAQETAAYSLEAAGKTARTLEWLKEFPSDLGPDLPDGLKGAYAEPVSISDGVYHQSVFWDMKPSFWTEDPIYFDPQRWRECPIALQCDIGTPYDYVTSQLDSLLASYGYVREENHYRVEEENTLTLTFFCHFAITCALISHLWNVSPFTLWFNTMIPPTGVSELVTEERVKGFARFRSLRIGDISHLYAEGEKPSFSGRFCECYSQMDKRH